MLLSGVVIATPTPRAGGTAAARAELLGGGLLATGLVLIGMGIQSSFD